MLAAATANEGAALVEQRLEDVESLLAGLLDLLQDASGEASEEGAPDSAEAEVDVDLEEDA